MQDNFFNSAADAVHSANPFKRLCFLQDFCDTLLSCYLLNQPFQHAYCSFVCISQMSVKCSVQDEPLIQPRMFRLQILHVHSAPFSNGPRVFITDYQIRVQYSSVLWYQCNPGSSPVSCNRLHLPEGVASSGQGVALTFQ